MMKKHINLLIFALTLLLASSLAASASALSCTINPENLWIDGNSNEWTSENNIAISCTCFGLSAWSELRDNSGIIERTNLDNSSGIYTGELSPDTPLPGGNYGLTTHCMNSENNSENTSAVIKINELRASISPSARPDAYPEDSLDIIISLKNNGEAVSSGVSFKVYLGGRELQIIENPSFSSGQWSVKAKIPGDFEDYGAEELKVALTYKDMEIPLVFSGYVNVKPLIDIRILDPPLYMSYRMTGSGDITVTAEVYYRKDIMDKSIVSGFEARLDDNELKIKDVDYAEDKWTLLVNVPERSSRNDPYGLEIYVKYNDILAKSSRSIPIQFIVPFEGTITDSKGNPAQNIGIKLKSPYFEEKMKTDSVGRYSTAVAPGKYDVYLSFNSFEADILDVDFFTGDNSGSKSSGLIRYDYFEEGDAGQKIVLALEFAIPFERAAIKVPYSAEDFPESGDLKVMACSTWNFKKRTCTLDWENADAVIDGKRNEIIISAKELSAFAILKKKNVNLDASLDRDKYPLKDKVMLSGKLLDEDLNAISGAAIIYTIDGLSGKTITDESGVFSASFKAPDKEGTFSLNIEARKDPYVVKKTIPLTTYRKSALTISATPSINIDLDVPAYLSFIVANDGQAPIDDINIYMTGIPSEWQSIDSRQISTLAVGEKKEIVMKIQVPKSGCSDASCRTENTFYLNAESKTSAATSSISMTINNAPSLNAKSNDGSASAREKTDTSTPAGFSVMLPANSGILAIMMAAIIAVLWILKKRTSSGADSLKRASLEREVNHVKGEVLKIGAANPKTRESQSAPFGTIVNSRSLDRNNLKSIIKNPFSTSK